MLATLFRPPPPLASGAAAGAGATVAAARRAGLATVAPPPAGDDPLALLVLLALLCLIGPSLSPWRDDAGDVLNINQERRTAEPRYLHPVAAGGADIADHRPGVDAAVGDAGLCAGGACRLSGRRGGQADHALRRSADDHPRPAAADHYGGDADRARRLGGLPHLHGDDHAEPALGAARAARSQMLRERDFMLATEVLGLSTRRRLFGHLLPNTVPILVVVATMAVANAILSESALSYLGLGVVPPTPSWGNMMDAANSLIDFQRRPWLWMPPGLAIFVTVVAINILGDGLRDALDPKMNGVTMSQPLVAFDRLSVSFQGRGPVRAAGQP